MNVIFDDCLRVKQCWENANVMSLVTKQVRVNVCVKHSFAYQNKQIMLTRTTVKTGE